jgi:hypothetical protein
VVRWNIVEINFLASRCSHNLKHHLPSKHFDRHPSNIYSKMASKDIPTEYICPITKKIMDDPMMSRHGQNFEREAILNWLAAEGNVCCPVTANPLRASYLISNKVLKMNIRNWRVENGEQVEYPDDDVDYLTKSFVGLVLVPPTEFICPITKDIMHDPIMTRDGRSFERSAILEHIDEKGCCPLTGKALLPSDLVPNGCLRKKLFSWQVKNAPALSANTYFMRAPRKVNLKAMAA